MLQKLNNYKKILSCRICNSKKIRSVYNFGSIPIGNDLQKNARASLNSKRYPLKLINCKKCNHFQISISINPRILYAKNYTYLTGVTTTFKKHFSDYSEWILKKCKLKKGSLILDIGSNDGTCLSFFEKKKMQVIGIDPAKKPIIIANKRGILTFNKFFNKNNAEQIEKKFGKFDFITSHNVLAHTENIQEIFLSIYDLLKENAFFCFEIGYFKDVVNNTLFDTIYHEHLDYHHAKPLISLLEKIGFSVINLSTNSIQGGTLRLLLKKNKFVKKKSSKIYQFLKKESKVLNLKNVKNKIKAFKKSIKLINKILSKEKSKNKSLYAYGSPTKASLLLTIANLNRKFIKYTFEDNKLKCNKYIPGSDIKIINSKNIIKHNPNIILILAWNFTNEIIFKLKKYNLLNTKVISPLPKPTIKII